MGQQIQRILEELPRLAIDGLHERQKKVRSLPQTRQNPDSAVSQMDRFGGDSYGETSSCIRPNCPRNHAEAMAQISSCIVHCNEVRLHSAIGFITPADRLCGLAEEIAAERDRKLEKARSRRRLKASENQLAISS